MGMLGEVFSALDHEPSLSAYSGAARKVRQSMGELDSFRAAVLSNHTFDIGTVLTVECARRGLGLTLYEAAFDQYRQELLSPEGGLDSFGPDAVLISLHLESTFPQLSAAACAATAELPAIEERTAEFHSLLSAWRERSSVPLFVLDFIPPSQDMNGLLSSGASLFGWTMELNRSLRAMAQGLPSVFMIDAARLACCTNLPEWRDARLWHLARAGINPKKFPALAMLVARAFAALRRPAAKCLVLDLDHTLWGGILGDAGADGIVCGASDYPAGAYAEFQRAVLALRSRGILLAVASKNDRANVDEAFRKRTDMPLQAGHISEWEVHWEPKPESLRRIAERLNIGLDSIVFLDDNPAEIDLVKMALPQVRAYPMPPRPEQFVPFLAGLEDFDQLQLSAEDLRRGELYELRKKQAEMAASATDLESFYRSLKTVLRPEAAGPGNFERIVQLVQKTNQFNLTTRRHDEKALAAHLDAGAELWAFRAADVHGDHGIIAVALLDFGGDGCTIDTFLMSCRVIGRTLETAILSFFERRAFARGAARLRGEYIPTPKNGLVRDCYRRHGFTCVRDSEAGTEWEKDLAAARTACPEWITIEAEMTTHA